MKKIRFKSIPCKHEDGAVADHAQRTPNYHPLTKKQIAELLDLAKKSSHPMTSKIQIRLCQGIPGYQCPVLCTGPVARKDSQISRLYVENYRKGADPKLVDKIYSIMMR